MSFNRAAHCRVIALKHGETRNQRWTPEYRLWVNIKTRCTNPNSSNYEWYGARGVTISPEWEKSFDRFLLDVGRRPSPKHTLDRIKNSRGYEPGNVRWVTHKENCRNTRKNVLLEFGGLKMCISAWAERLGMKESTVYTRLRKGWSVEDALDPIKRRPGPRPENQLQVTR